MAESRESQVNDFLLLHHTGARSGAERVSPREIPVVVLDPRK